MFYTGDYAEDATVYLMFNTFTSDDPSASSTITNFVNTDVHIHKDDGLTQRNNAAGITVSVNFDGITGSHQIKIDTNDNTVADFWVTGSDYFVRIEGTTVDAATLNVVVGHFSIENRYNPVTDYDGPTNAEMVAAFTEIKGATWAAGTDTIEHIRNKQTDIETDTAEIGAAGAGLTNIGTIATCTTNTDMRGTDNAALAAVLGALNNVAAAGEVTDVDTLVQYIKQLINILIGTPGIGTFPAEAAPGNAVSLAEVIRAIHVDVTGLNGDAMRGTDGANTTVPDAAGTAPTVTEIQTEMEENGASLLDTIRDQIGTAGAGLTDLGGMSAGMKGEVNAEAVDALATDTYAEPGQEAPGATVSLSTKIGYLYKFLRNKIANDGTDIEVYNDAGGVVDQKAGVSEAAGTVTRNEFVSGP